MKSDSSSYSAVTVCTDNYPRAQQNGCIVSIYRLLSEYCVVFTVAMNTLVNFVLKTQYIASCLRLTKLKDKRNSVSSNICESCKSCKSWESFGCKIDEKFEKLGSPPKTCGQRMC